ncbi:LysR family transcriptional regulator [Bordetella genomosp. 4]|uniref:LysR family transcriptional regulator n=1 Tax=Bordetella genomosp. 4 TaxID=463044 RepID=A0A261TNJ8_9BORD|nr:LysR family transcriptional regulator [Bordetella genomosp. 4]OZI43334.1 LysR family transcriptional regulator [Bordetella genomosp. 4]OZI50871.1 LysR family transcriptional regulator [Bordetella genomosp. 4]
MEFRQIQYFICLFEEGSVTRAARRLNIVQPALSMQIARLEDELGQQLFERSQQGMQPTSAARQMYRLFLPILRDFTHAREQVLRKDGELHGHVNIGIIASVAQGVLSDAVEEFTTQHPKVTLTVTDGYSATLADRVAGGELDAAFINKPRRPLALNLEHVVDEDMVLVTGADHHQHLPASVPLRDVIALDLALPTRKHGLRLILESFAQAEDIDLTPVFEFDSIVSIIKLVERTRFVTLLPRVAISNRVQRGRLKCHEVVSPRLIRQIARVTHPRRALSAEASAFVALLSEHMRRLDTSQQSSKSSKK